MNKLKFGTAGIRGILGKNKENINSFHVARVIEGYAKYLTNKYKDIKKKIVIIGRDNREKSKEFAQLAALILTKYKIHAYISKYILATPIISYSIKYHKAIGGINVTASHNPKEYNGIKLYDSNGSQILENVVDKIKNYFLPYENYLKKDKLKELKNNGKNEYYEFLPNKTIESYLKKVINIGGFSKDLSNIKVAFSPQHGTGAKPVKHLFSRLKLKAFYEEKQMKNDTQFSFTKSPNPENKEAYEAIITLGKKNQADLILTTDPDSDRVGIGVWNNNDYVLLNGNETAILIFEYLLELNKNNLKNRYIIYSFVSTSLVAKMAKENGIAVYEVSTGFKYIGNLIEQLKKSKPELKFLFAFEESYGSLINEKLAYDKDALQSVVILTKMASYYKKQNKSLLETIESIYIKYGYMKSESISINLDNSKTNQLAEIQKKFIKLETKYPYKVQDFNNGYKKIAPSNMLKLVFNDGSWISLRPSGTEHKIKFYVYVISNNKDETQKKYKYFISLINYLL